MHPPGFSSILGLHAISASLMNISGVFLVHPVLGSQYSNNTLDHAAFLRGSLDFPLPSDLERT